MVDAIIFIIVILFFQIYVFQFWNIILNNATLPFLYQFGFYVRCDLFNREKIKVILGRACSGWWRRKYNSNTSATSTLEMGVWSAQYPRRFSRERYPRRFSRERYPRPSAQEARLSAGSFWSGMENSLHSDSIPDRLACSQSLYRLSYLGRRISQ